MTYLVGIDGGGTSCRVAIADTQGKILASVKGGEANIVTNIEKASSNIISLVEEAFRSASIDLDYIENSYAYLGLAGANLSEYEERLHSLLPFKKFEINSDAMIAYYGGMGDADGVVCIIGTGSVYITKECDEIKIYGGWGFNVGDQASGAWLGRKLLSKVLDINDGISPKTDLSEKIFKKFNNCPQEIVLFANAAAPNDFGSLVPYIIDAYNAKDKLALNIVSEAKLKIEEVLKAINPNSDKIISFMGGLGDFYAMIFKDKYTTFLQKPKGNALDGAVTLALRGYKNIRKNMHDNN